MLSVSVYISHVCSFQVAVKIITCFTNIFSGNMQHNFNIKKLALDYLKTQTESALLSIVLHFRSFMTLQGIRGGLAFVPSELVKPSESFGLRNGRISLRSDLC